jgi:hypothetical protein
MQSRRRVAYLWQRLSHIIQSAFTFLRYFYCKVPKAKKIGFREVIFSSTVHDSLEEAFGAIKCESGNVEMQWNNMKKCVLDTMSDLVGKVERRAKSRRLHRI